MEEINDQANEKQAIVSLNPLTSENLQYVIFNGLVSLAKKKRNICSGPQEIHDFQCLKAF